MSIIHDDIRAPDPERRAWFGTIARNVADIADKLYVEIPDLSGDDLLIGPCPWQSRDEVTLPGAGDECLVMFDNRSNPWVVAWWPFGD